MNSINEISRLAAFVLYTLSLLAAPWIFRSKLSNADEWVYLGFLVSAVLTLTALWTTGPFQRRQYSFARLTVASLPLVAGILLGIFQTIPLSEGLLQTLSPGIEKQTAQLLPASGSEEAQLEDRIFPPTERQNNSRLWPSTISVYPQNTVENLAVLTLVVLVFAVGGILFQTPRSRLVLWKLVAVNGILLALFVMISKSLGDESFYHRFWPDALCGPFVNRNGMAGYLCLCLGPAVGLLVRTLLHVMRSRDEEVNVYEGIRYRGSGDIFRRFLNGISDFLTLFSRNVFLWLGAVGLILAGIAVTFSRGGTLAALFSFLLAILVFAGKKRAGFYLIPLWTSLLAGLFFIFWMGMTEPVQKRMGTLFSTEEQESAVVTNGRLEYWQGAWQTIKDYHGRGTGLGTYALANRSHDTALRENRYCHFAENQAIETTLTAGIPGLVLLIAEWLLFWFFILNVTGKKTAENPVEGDNSDRTASDTPFLFGIGMIVILTGQTVSGSFDFGLFLYPNAVLMAALCGSFVGGRFSDDEENDPDAVYWSDAAGKESAVWSVVFSLLTLGVLVLGFTGYQETIQQKTTENLLQRFHFGIEPDRLDGAFLDKALSEFTLAAEKRPDDATLHYQLAQIHLLRFRYFFWQRLMEESPETDRTELWNRTDPQAIFAYLSPLIRGGMVVIPRRLRNAPVVTENVIPAMRELFFARRLCPLFPEPHLHTALLLPLVSDSKNLDALVETSVRRATTVSPNETPVLFTAGMIRFRSGDRDGACQYWRQSLAQSKESFQDIVGLLSSVERTKAEFCRRLQSVVGDQWDLIEKGINLYPKASEPVIYDVLLTVMEKILEETPDKMTGNYFRNRAHFERLSERFDDALADYQKATSENPFNARWFYEYGTLLYNQKKGDESIAAFTKADELDPHNKTYEHALRRAEEFKRQQIFDEFK